jgi:hypothetical protein
MQQSLFPVLTVIAGLSIIGAAPDRPGKTHHLRSPHLPGKGGGSHHRKNNRTKVFLSPSSFAIRRGQAALR